MNEQFEHDWQVVPVRRGKYAGQPMKQRQCPKCQIWETELSLKSWCIDGRAVWPSSGNVVQMRQR